jgi:hypothetical protein
VAICAAFNSNGVVVSDVDPDQAARKLAAAKAILTLGDRSARALLESLAGSEDDIVAGAKDLRAALSDGARRPEPR